MTTTSLVVALLSIQALPAGTKVLAPHFPSDNEVATAMRSSWVTLGLGGLLCAGTVSCWDQDPTAPGGSDRMPALTVAADTTITSLTAEADTYLRKVAPNQNRGDKDRLWVRGRAGKTRSLIRFDTTAIRSALGSTGLAYATITVAVDTAFGWASSGRFLSVYSLNQPWTEVGATHDCANDTDPSNGTLECALTDQWDMAAGPDGSYASVATDSVFVSNASTGTTLEFDVTSDVAAFIAGAPLHGWLVTKSDETKGGQIRLSSREGTTPPQIQVGASNDPPSPVLTATADAFVRKIEPNQNRGSRPQMWIRGTGGKTRALVQFDSAQIRASIGGFTLQSATLEMVVDTAFSWGAAGRFVGAYSAQQPWTEAGVTYNCANDTDPSNLTLECDAADVWDMGGAPAARPYAQNPTDSVLVTNNSAGTTLSLDVTADVAAFLAGGNAHGWLITKVLEDKAGQVKLGSREGGQAATLELVVGQSTSVPLLPPDSTPTWLWSDTALAPVPGVNAEASNHVVIVYFDAASTEAERIAAINAVGGEIVGGFPVSVTSGGYYIRISGGGTPAAIDAAIDTLRGLAGVWDAGRVIKAIPNSFGLTANDGPGWTPDTWSFVDSLAAGENWALEASAFPLAWGCSVGDDARPLYVMDHGFRTANDLAAGIIYNAIDITDSSDPDFDHGTQVLSVIAAEANSVGSTNPLITGATWNRSVEAVELWPTTLAGQPQLRGPAPGTWFFSPAADLGTALVRATSGHGRAINISQGILWTTPPESAADSAKVRDWAQVLDFWLQGFQAPGAGDPPLVVLAAGNEATTQGADAYWAGLPSVNDPTLPILVVAGYDSTDTFWSESKGGLLVDVVAPAVDVTLLDAQGKRQNDGTSFAAPQATALANLLSSFDPSLTSLRIKQLIINGAIASGKTIGGFPVLNAYESLRLAAQKPGTPLCGNRSWLDGGSLVVERGATNETIHTRSPDIHGGVEVFHGGRRIDYVTFQAETPHSLTFTQGTGWLEGTRLPAPPATGPTSPLRHFGDSTIVVDFQPQVATKIVLRDTVTAGEVVVASLPAGTQIWRPQFSPVDRSTIYFMQRTTGVNWLMRELNRATGTTTTLWAFVSPLPNSFLTVSHDGSEAIVAQTGGGASGCVMFWRPLVSGATVSKSITVAPARPNRCVGQPITQNILTPENTRTVVADGH